MKKFPNVLLLEDSNFIISIMEIMFTSYINNFFITDDAKEALRIFYQGDIDIVISDVHLGEFNTSIPLLEELKFRSEKVIVHSTDESMLDILKRKYQYKGWLFLEKNSRIWVRSIKRYLQMYTDGRNELRASSH